MAMGVGEKDSFLVEVEIDAIGLELVPIIIKWYLPSC